MSASSGPSAAASAVASFSAPTGSPGEEHRAAQPVREVGARPRVGQRLADLEQVLRRRRAVRQHLGDAEGEQHLGALLRRGRLLERAAQVGHGALRRAAAHGVAPRPLQQLRGPGGAAARREQQLRRDLLDVRARLAEHLRRALVLQLALGGRELVVDGVAHERVDEAERRLGADDLRADELARRRRPPRARRGRPARRRAGARRSPRARRSRAPPPGRRSERRESRSSTVLDTARGPTARTTSTWSATGWTPSASSARRSWRSSSGLPPVAWWQAAQKPGSASSPRRSRTSAATASALSGPGRSGCVAGSWTISASSAGIGPRLRRAQRRGDQHRRAVEPPREVGEEAQRRPVRPVEVVDGQQQRLLRGEVEREPVERVQRRERGRALLVGRLLEQRAGGRGGARQLAACGDPGLEQLAHDAVGELALELPGARLQHLQRRLRALAQARRGGRTCRCRPGPRSARGGRCPRPRRRRARRAP